MKNLKLRIKQKHLIHNDINYVIKYIPFESEICIKRCLGSWRRSGKRAVNMNFDKQKFSIFYPNGMRNHTVDETDFTYVSAGNKHDNNVMSITIMLPPWLKKMFYSKKIHYCGSVHYKTTKEFINVVIICLLQDVRDGY